MKQYPINIPRKIYRGSKRNLQLKNQEENRIASEIEKVVNEMIAASNENIVKIMYHDVAHKTGYSIEKVREILCSVDAGHNGFTAFKKHSNEL